MSSAEAARMVVAGGKPRILVTGGGTGGLTTPAVAAIEAIRKAAEAGRWTAEFTYLGSARGMERDVAAKLGVPFIGIETGKLRRSRRLIGLLSRSNLLDAIRVPFGYIQALGVVRRVRPHVVLSTGGYVSVPGVLAAAVLRVPIVAHEQTAQVGLANKINFRFASVIAVSIEDSLLQLSKGQAKRAVVTGNPVRESVLQGDGSKAATLYGIDLDGTSLPVVYVTGGAQGSRIINRAVAEMLPQALEICRIIHQCGAQQDGGARAVDHLRDAASKLPEGLRARYAVTEFVGSEIGDVYALADVVVGRSGAGTVTEVCAMGKPAVFVPLVPTGGDEQTRNAQRLVDAGAAVIVKQDELTGETLLAAICSIVGDAERRAAMGCAALTLARPDAAEMLAGLVIEQGARSS